MLTESPESFLNNSSIGIHAVSSEGIVVYANQCELETLGFNKDEYVGHHVSEFQFTVGNLIRHDKLIQFKNKN